MPTYDFKCNNGHTFEVFFKQVYNDKKIIYCPVCFEIAKKIFSKNEIGFILNGSGWAKDGYSHKKNNIKND